MVKKIITIRQLFILGILIFQTLHCLSQSVPPPPNQPAIIQMAEKKLTILYNNRPLFEGEFSDDISAIRIFRVTDTFHQAVSQVIKFAHVSEKKISINGTVYGSEESFPCTIDRPTHLEDDIVRNSAGLSQNLLNKAVYDRKWDWVFSVDHFANTQIKPKAAVNNISNTFSVAIEGNEITIRFQPRYYQLHRGLKYFEPWKYKIWDQSVAGWCSWYAYMDNVNENNIKETASVISARLARYGYQYIQIDDGYQQSPIGMPDTWLHTNNKFPSGLSGLVKSISSKGLSPAIWTNVSFANPNDALAHKNLFVQGSDGKPAAGNWIGYSVDGSNPEALNKIIRPVYRDLKAMGWKYFKLDALRHLRYEGYNSNADFFARKKVSRETAFRNVVKAVREEIGKENFLLACWGVLPEVIGLADACRIGNDGYLWQTMAQYNSFNNVVWRNDPDHVQLSTKNAYRDCMVASLTGSLLMLTDKPEVYTTANVEAALRTAPVLFTRPSQIYDVDPRRSMYLNREATEMSGAGQREFDADGNTPYDVFSLEINKPYENWMLLGRVGEKKNYISFQHIGLDINKSYLVFEFWSKKLLGVFSKGFKPGAIDSALNCQLFCIRELVSHPQLLATNRHISCGAVDVTDLAWKGKALCGTSEVLAGENYVLYLHEPKDFNYASFECKDARLINAEKDGDVRRIEMQVDKEAKIEWKINYR